LKAEIASRFTLHKCVSTQRRATARHAVCVSHGGNDPSRRIISVRWTPRQHIAHEREAEQQ
jgi:hypothetical protein